MRKRVTTAILLTLAASVAALAAPASANASTTTPTTCRVGGGWPTIVTPTR